MDYKEFKQVIIMEAVLHYAFEGSYDPSWRQSLFSHWKTVSLSTTAQLPYTKQNILAADLDHVFPLSLALEWLSQTVH